MEDRREIKTEKLQNALQAIIDLHLETEDHDDDFAPIEEIGMVLEMLLANHIAMGHDKPEEAIDELMNHTVPFLKEVMEDSFVCDDCKEKENE